MKKIFLLGIILFLITGCTSINNLSIDEIINDGFSSKINIYNTNRKGYHYYLPKGLVLETSDNYNEVIKDYKYIYYLYVDIVSYHNKASYSYEENSSAYFSKKLTNGYVEINSYKNNNYLIEIMNNYAKIEVVVKNEDLKKSLTYAIAILSSITYNDNIIDNYLKSEDFKSNPQEFDIFEVVGKDNYLEFSKDEVINGRLKILII